MSSGPKTPQRDAGRPPRTGLAALATAWRRLWGSVAFRLTLNYSLLAVCTTIFLLIFAYGKIVDVLQVQFSRQVTLTMHRLVLHYQERGATSLQHEIRQLLSDQTDIDTEMYLLLDRNGAKLAGNLNMFEAGDLIRDPPVPLQSNVLRDGVSVSGVLVAQRLGDGDILVVGRDTQDLKEIKDLIGKAVIVATLVALFLVLIGTLIFRRELRRRVEAIRDTAIHVGTGELTRRVPAAADADEFDQLRSDINHMLDRIENLMKGVRNVSDSIAHNMRTPLTRVLARLHKAQSGARDAQALGAAIDAASAEILELIAMSEKLLLIAEAESGVRRQAFQAVRLDAIARDVLELYEALAEEKGVALRLAVAQAGRTNGSVRNNGTHNGAGDEGVWVAGDADLLAGVISNLVDNALKYAGRGACATISVARRDSLAVLTVRDNGPGVAEDELRQLGKRFYRAPTRSRSGLPGSGLGLASVRAVVALHEGRLAFRDAAPGLEVEIELPSAIPPADHYDLVMKR